ncbi:hypothetical protein ACJIZ3_014168 [Penstemon smallii]|uniref:Bidirectional sugar transporter SWEET n=1 Tax=Penstemon smallii TaxID=265156 RepID=A0ABD3RIS4_9LAMI
MVLSTWSIFFGILGNISASLLFLSPTLDSPRLLRVIPRLIVAWFSMCRPTFWCIVKKKSVQDFSSIPYVILLLNASFWTYYGVITPNGLLLITINGFGATVQAIYVIIFLIYAPRKLKVKTAALSLILNVGFYVAAILITRLALDKDTQIKTIGEFYSTVVKTRSVEYMPFFLSFFSFLVALSWAIYAVLIPNVTGLALGVCQLVLYAIYRNATPISKDNEKPPKIADVESNLEEGSKHEIPSSK